MKQERNLLLTVAL